MYCVRTAGQRSRYDDARQTTHGHMRRNTSHSRERVTLYRTVSIATKQRAIHRVSDIPPTHFCGEFISGLSPAHAHFHGRIYNVFTGFRFPETIKIFSRLFFLS